jgi:hypothetical protein
MGGGFRMPSKPKPTKPEIKLSKKVKPYQWRRILKEPEDKEDRVHVVWDDIKEVEIDQAEVEELFEDKKKVKLVPDVSPTKQKKGKNGLNSKLIIIVNVKKTFFDAETSQKMCIVLKRLPKPHVTIEILSKLDERFIETIQPSVVNGILRSWPDDSEVQTLLEEDASNPDEQWDFAEDYVINLKSIKNIKQK